MYLEKSGQFRTDSLFFERIAKRHKQQGIKPLYCLSERQDKGECKRLYEIFINSVDEYAFAIKAFGCKAQLDKLKEIKWFREGWVGCKTFRGYNAWLEDMRERDASTAKRVLIEKTLDGDISAAKKLADMSKPAAGTKGRPKKEDIRRESVRLAEEKTDVEDDLKRLGSSKILEFRG